MKTLEEKIKEITEADFDVHHIFKKIVNKQTGFTENEEIVNLVFVKRKHLDDRDKSSSIISPAKLIVATTQGIIFVEEGFEEISENYLGYKIKHIYYDKISSFELDICLLEAKFMVVANSAKDPEIYINFNTALYYKKFEKFVDVARQCRIKCSD
ncbi:PH domain-containing protein [Halanaerobium hydrogeniformans]|uniref:YokE-like PH domain-containing protein n=1 Tax=Halanaerobium hydrogeniformans TaxID=656519 RepID=E4RNY0_HALHG|nr:PH domain-containing protein [Halanaerobium hydrogeniformans]ADQ13670.1 hypothetical protein Halsa_0181 [Halanaerobium hydrogeniformans]